MKRIDSLKNTQKNLIESFKEELRYLETSLYLNSHPNHPHNDHMVYVGDKSKTIKEKLDEITKQEEIKERISLYQLLIQEVKNFKYQEENKWLFSQKIFLK